MYLAQASRLLLPLAAGNGGLLSIICFVLAAVWFFLGMINFSWMSGTPPTSHSLNWISGGLMWVVIGLWLAPLL